ncbi:MAG: 50S ribosomal protein L5 [Gammaproteobacteria bacterium]|nr:50S ribosomal protein L5 [Gammaproteobacteria bacterium]
MATFQKLYQDTVRNKLMEQFSYKSIMQVPKVQKITLNIGLDAAADKKVLANAISDLTLIAGQKAVPTMARKSIAGFKIREGWPIGCKVTLRGERMFEMLERLVCYVFPRIRDFRGFSPKGFDGQGNYNLGIKEQIVFPEIDYDKIDAIRGLNIAITTSAKTDQEARALLSAFKFPFKE